ncbi:MAG: putative lipoprotein [Saprospiraceae bacterium]|jgi:predicted lipoprotein
MKGLITSFLIIVFLFATQSCGDTEPIEPEIPIDNFDRGALLTDIADNVIIPGYIRYATDIANLDLKANTFANNPTADRLFQLKLDFRKAYITWQRVSIFEIGKAESLALRNNTNIFPANVVEIEANIAMGNYNLALPSKIDEQGFPALDYLLYGTAESEMEVVEYFKNNSNAGKYLTDLTSRLQTLSTEVRDDWTNGYRETFIGNDGSSATGSLNKLVNDYIFYYEKFLRAGKIGIPAGVFSGSPLPNKVEGLYSETNSKLFFLTGLSASKEFFLGSSSYSDEIGESLKSYLDYQDQVGNDLSGKILAQFDVIETKANGLESSFVKQIESDNSKMLETYDELQKNVILLKVDMLQALNIKVDFVDADGD